MVRANHSRPNLHPVARPEMVAKGARTGQYRSVSLQTEKATTAWERRSDNRPGTQSAVVPACALRAAVEPLPERITQDAIVK